jgi:hypothetical protein
MASPRQGALKRDPYAKAVRDPKGPCRPRSIPSRKRYQRRPKHKGVG